MVSDEDEAGEAGRGGEEELEMTGLGGEEPVGLAAGGDEHGGDSVGLGRLGR